MQRSWQFLTIMLLTYAVLGIAQPAAFAASTIFFYNILLRILPVFALVYALMTVANFYITPKFVIKHLREKGIKKWVCVILGGILSTGPIYMWYPLLADLREKGLREGLIACFLYNRAIKLPFLPVAVVYFGWSYVIVLSCTMITISIAQGIIINKLEVQK